MDNSGIDTEIRLRLTETGGRISQDLGAGRVVGQVLIYLYLQENECSLDSIGEGLGLSKASMSIAVRQLEHLGLVRKVWIKGDRKNYYQSADNIADALQRGLLGFVRQKTEYFGSELDYTLKLVENSSNDLDNKSELMFLHNRISRAKKLQKLLHRVLCNPLIGLVTRNKKNDVLS